jgi:PKD repeat protein
MKTSLKTVALLGLSLPLFSQTQVSGIINDYAAVNAIDPCEAKLTVADASAFNPGDDVYLIQMQGASINTSNSSSFGNIDELNAAGLFEKNEVLSVAGNDIFLKKELLNPYSVTGKLQLIRYIKYATVEITGDLQAKPWDGASGGVLVLEASNISFGANIDLSGQGFRGAQQVVVSSNCNFLTTADAYHYSISDWKGSPKGEGIAAPVTGKEHGRGAQANGGGGGNDHNSGGGGGGNTSAGGNGGNQNVGGLGCDGEYPGKGGKASPIEAERVYLGGGGGAGHVDDTGAGSSGANGGGIAIILAQSIEGNGFSILSNGLTPPIAHGDGAGGGGGGGTILLKANNLVGSLAVVAKGGKGGDVINSSDRCDGAGGGGSGGRLLTNLSNITALDLQGGDPGINTVASGQCNGPSNGAKKGDDGAQANLSYIPSSFFDIGPVEVIEQPSPIVTCVGQQASVNFQVQGNYLTYQWQLNTGTGWANVPTNSIYVGGLTSELVILNIVPAMNGFQYRCVVSSPCIPTFYSDVIDLELSDLPQANFIVLPLGNGTYQFQNNSSFSTSFHWDFGDGMTSDEANPTHHFEDFGDYTVVLTVVGPCGQDVFEFNLTVATFPTADFSFQNMGNCAPQTVQFTNLSSANASSFQWILPGGSPNSSTENSPSITYTVPGIFDVVLIAQNAVGADTFVMPLAIEVGGPPIADFDLAVNNLTVNFTNLSLNASNGFLWDFGDGNTSTLQNPMHDYGLQGLYEVSLTAYNDCGETTVSMSVPTGALPLANFSANTTAGCNPLTVQFQDQSFGTNLTGLLWEFPGGDPSTSTEPNPIITYSAPGVYEVSLTATNSLGSHTKHEAGFIQVYPTPVADFGFWVNGQVVYFTNNSIDGSFYVWDFGDGNTSNATNPVHEYASTGVFDVNLTAANLKCGSGIAYQVYLAPSATKEKQEGEGIRIFPNPTNGKCTVELEDVGQAIDVLKLRDATGRLILLKDNSAKRAELDLKEMAAGLYILEIMVNGKWHTKILLRQ